MSHQDSDAPAASLKVAAAWAGTMFGIHLSDLVLLATLVFTLLQIAKLCRDEWPRWRRRRRRARQVPTEGGNDEMSANLYPVCLRWEAGRGRARHDGVDRLLERAPDLGGELGRVDRIEFIPGLHVFRVAERSVDRWRDLTPDEVAQVFGWLEAMSGAARAFDEREPA